MNTIIYGPQSSGKTTLVQQLTEGKKTVCLHYTRIDDPFIFQDVEIDTDCIVIDEIPLLNQKTSAFIRNLFFCEDMVIDRLGEKRITIKKPKRIIVVISENSINPDFYIPDSNLQIIKCISCNHSIG